MTVETPSLASIELRDRALNFRERLVDLMRECASRVCELEPPRNAIEKQQADLRFEGLDAVADGALGAMQLGSGFGEAQVPSCNRKDVQRIERGKACHFALRMQCRDA